MIVTIDGPAASGKSSTARLIAQKLGWCHINSGLLYRALAYVLINEKKYDASSLAQCAAKDVDYYTDTKKFHAACTNNQTTIYFDGKDISSLLKTPEIGNAASIISTNAHVREKITDLQRSIAHNINCIVDGRDAGSVVFPNAELKFFLTASVHVRAERLMQEQAALGKQISLPDAERQIIERDERDKNRAIAPLVIPQGAIVIDNSAMSQEQVVEMVLSKIYAKN